MMFPCQPQLHSSVKDTSWVCIFCKQASHHKGLGDLFGPYYIPLEAKVSPDNQSNDVEMKIESTSEGISENLARSKVTYEKRRLSDPHETSILEKKLKNCENSNVAGVRDSSGNNPPQQEVWFHEDCLVWSNGVYLVGHRIRNIEEVIKDSRENICCNCRLGGASLACPHRGCSPRFHYICAKEKGCDMDEEDFSIYCPKHRKKRESS